MGKDVKFLARMRRGRVRLNKNQMLLLDALLEHGGYVKKYLDRKKRARFSEHFGLIDIHNGTVDRIIVSAKTFREDEGDPDILLPGHMHDSTDYEYVFHTHPPTPRPGGRAGEGVLLELPSINDIFHFIEHYNDGCTQGSIVLAAEGVYVIRKRGRKKRIAYDAAKEDELMETMDIELSDIHARAVERYGTGFSTATFFATIAQDASFLHAYNRMLAKYLDKQVGIKYYPRVFSATSKRWEFPEITLALDPDRPARSRRPHHH